VQYISLNLHRDNQFYHARSKVQERKNLRYCIMSWQLPPNPLSGPPSIV